MKNKDWSIEDVVQGIVWTLAIFLLPGVPELASFVFISDKEAHFFFFFWALLIWTNIERNYLMVVLVLAVLGLSIEIIQGWLPGRSLDMEDLFVDVIGVGIGILFRIAFDLRYQAKFKPFHFK